MLCGQCFEGLRCKAASLLDLSQPRSRVRQCTDVVNVGHLHFWQKRAVLSALPLCDDGLLDHVVGFVGDIEPPPLAVAPFAPSCTKRLLALTADASGGPVLLGAPADEMILLSWNVESKAKKLLRGLTVQASCVWLDLAADRAAAGCIYGSVHIWAFSTGVLLANCVSQVLESTRWTTVGHTTKVLSLTSAPRSAAMGDWYASGVLGTTVASGDSSGVVCLWCDDGHPAMTACAAFEVKKLGLTSTSVAALAASPGLLACCLPEAIVGFQAPGGYPMFILCTSEVLQPARQLQGHFCALTVATREPQSDEARIAAVTECGAMVLWDVHLQRRGTDDVGSFIKRPVLTPQPGRMLAQPFRTGPQEHLASWNGFAASRNEILCWACARGPREAVIRWARIETAATSPAAIESPIVLQASVRRGDIAGARVVVVLPQKVSGALLAEC